MVGVAEKDAFSVRLTAEDADRRPVAEGDTVTLGWNDADTRNFSD